MGVGNTLPSPRHQIGIPRQDQLHWSGCGEENGPEAQKVCEYAIWPCKGTGYSLQGNWKSSGSSGLQ